MRWIRRLAVPAAVLAIAVPATVVRFAPGKHTQPEQAASPSPSPSLSVKVRFVTPSPLAPTPEPAIAQRLLVMTNSERTKRGLRPLTWWPAALPVAMAQTERMVRDQRLYHNSGLNGWLYRLKARMLGENVGVGPNIDAVQSAFMHSREHKDNILTPAYRLVAIYVIRDTRHFLWVTVNFGQT